MTLSTIIIIAIVFRDRSHTPNRPRPFRQRLGLLEGFFVCCLQPQLRVRFHLSGVFAAPLGSCIFFFRSPSPTLALAWFLVWLLVWFYYGNFFGRFVGLSRGENAVRFCVRPFSVLFLEFPVEGSL